QPWGPRLATSCTGDRSDDHTGDHAEDGGADDRRPPAENGCNDRDHDAYGKPGQATTCGELGPSRLLCLGLSRWARAGAGKLWIGAHPTILTRSAHLRYLPVLEI